MMSVTVCCLSSAELWIPQHYYYVICFARCITISKMTTYETTIMFRSNIFTSLSNMNSPYHLKKILYFLTSWTFYVHLSLGSTATVHWLKRHTDANCMYEKLHLKWATPRKCFICARSCSAALVRYSHLHHERTTELRWEKAMWLCCKWHCGISLFSYHSVKLAWSNCRLQHMKNQLPLLCSVLSWLSDLISH